MADLPMVVDVPIEPGRMAYVSLDGLTRHWPGPDPWKVDESGQFAPSVPDLDLANLRLLCIQTLRKVEDELDRRGLLHRVTPGSDLWETK